MACPIIPQPALCKFFYMHAIKVSTPVLAPAAAFNAAVHAVKFGGNKVPASLLANSNDTHGRMTLAFVLPQSQVNEFGGRWFINPGSITGAYSALETDAVPSFILLAVQGAKCVTYVYELHGDQVEVSKSEFSKAA